MLYLVVYSDYITLYKRVFDIWDIIRPKNKLFADQSGVFFYFYYFPGLKCNTIIGLKMTRGMHIQQYGQSFANLSRHFIILAHLNRRIKWTFLILMSPLPVVVVGIIAVVVVNSFFPDPLGQFQSNLKQFTIYKGNSSSFKRSAIIWLKMR